MAKSTKRFRRVRLDLSTAIGLLCAFCCILGGLLLEGGRLADILQLSAFVIVVGGTAGAVMITTPADVLLAAVRQLPVVFLEPPCTVPEAIHEIIRLAEERRRHLLLVSIDSDVNALSDPFLRRAFTLAVDGIDSSDIREILEVDLVNAEQRGDLEAKVFEVAAGYAPTVGILGAVIGLIQVMKNLDHMEAVGQGIAVAFVATIYGIFLANVVFLPIANKLRTRLAERQLIRELALEGAVAIIEECSGSLLRTKLESYHRQATEVVRPWPASAVPTEPAKPLGKAS